MGIAENYDRSSKTTQHEKFSLAEAIAASRKAVELNAR